MLDVARIYFLVGSGLEILDEFQNLVSGDGTGQNFRVNVALIDGGIAADSEITALIQ